MQPRTEATWLSPIRVAATVFLVAVLIAAPSIRNGFVFDDVGVIEENEIVHQLELGRLVTSPYWPPDRGSAMWRPLALVAFAVQWAVGGGGPGVFHLTNILLYGVVSGLVALLAAQLFTARLGLMAGVLFAVHPVHVEVTANVVGQVEMLAALGYLGGLWAVWKRMEASDAGRRRVLLAVAALCLAVGLASKEHCVTFPGAVLLLWCLERSRGDHTWLGLMRREWPVLAVSAVLIIGYLVGRGPMAYGLTATGGAAAGLDVYSPVSRAVVMLPVSLKWLELLFIPVRLSADYSLRHLVPAPVFGPVHASALLIWILLFLCIWRAKGAVPALAFGAALFVVTVSVVSNIVVPIGVLLAERLLFLPSIGWAVAVGGLLVALESRMGMGRPRRVLWFAVALVVVLFAVRSATRALVWYDKEVFFTQLLRDAPQSFRAHWVIGDMAFERGDSAVGEREMSIALRLNPDHPHLLEEFGLRYETTGRYQPAIPLLARAVAVDSTRLSSALPLARALARTGRATEALVVLDAMSRLHGETKGIALVRGEALLLAGEADAAWRVLSDLLQRDPSVWTVRGMVAEAAARSGRCEIALAQVDTAVRVAPAEVHEGLLAIRTWVANGNAPCK
ncbi:MAG: tetratricopeptide repeat protein [Gemmatimonadota bacterium]|nr:MAG: tetratricopeptide repeat protein [Gemmatimonadota bacterium]